MSASSGAGNDLKPANVRFAAAAAARGLAIRIVTHARPTRTADEAAAACGCSVGQIVKSLVFRGRDTGRPILLLVSGANRVDEAGVARTIGEALQRPDAAFVRELTGFAIGGIPPLGHAAPLTTYIDRDLLTFASVWAAAGTPESVFEVAPADLATAAAATPIAMT